MIKICNVLRTEAETVITQYMLAIIIMSLKHLLIITLPGPVLRPIVTGRPETVNIEVKCLEVARLDWTRVL